MVSICVCRCLFFKCVMTVECEVVWCGWVKHALNDVFWHWASPSKPAQQGLEVIPDKLAIWICQLNLQCIVSCCCCSFLCVKSIITDCLKIFVTSGMLSNCILSCLFFIFDDWYVAYTNKNDEQNDYIWTKWLHIVCFSFQYLCFLLLKNWGYKLSTVQHCKRFMWQLIHFLVAYCSFAT